MRTRYLTGYVVAHRQTDKAFLCSFNWSDSHGYVASEQWVPLSCIHESEHDAIEEAADSDVIEISIAEWWLRANL